MDEATHFKFGRQIVLDSLLSACQSHTLWSSSGDNQGHLDRCFYLDVHGATHYR